GSERRYLKRSDVRDVASIDPTLGGALHRDSTSRPDHASVEKRCCVLRAMLSDTSLHIAGHESRPHHTPGLQFDSPDGRLSDLLRLSQSTPAFPASYSVIPFVATSVANTPLRWTA